MSSEPHDDVARETCIKLHGNLAYVLSGGMRRHGEAAKQWARVLELSGELVSPDFRINWALELLKNDEMVKAWTQIQHVKSMKKLSPVERYNLACFLCIYATAVHNDEPHIRRGARSESSSRASATLWTCSSLLRVPGCSDLLRCAIGSSLTTT